MKRTDLRFQCLKVGHKTVLSLGLMPIKPLERLPKDALFGGLFFPGPTLEKVDMRKIVKLPLLPFDFLEWTYVNLFSYILSLDSPGTDRPNRNCLVASCFLDLHWSEETKVWVHLVPWVPGTNRLI